MEVMAPVVSVLLETIIGFFSNVFILSVIFFDFYKERHISNSNKILVGISISNVSYNTVISAGLLDEFIGLRVSSTMDLSSLYIILLLYGISSCAWLTASLGAFYYIKVSQTRLLTWVKFHISSIVPWMLLVLEVVSFITSFSGSLLIISPQTSSRNITNSLPSFMEVLAKNSLGLMNSVISVTFIPFVLILFSIACTVWTLKQHSQKMERSMETVDNRRLTSYERVVGRMTRFLFFYIIFYTLMLILYFSVITRLQSGFWGTLLLLCSFTPVQSVFLILGNPRFIDAWKEMLHYETFTRFLSRSNEG